MRIRIAPLLVCLAVLLGFQPPARADEARIAIRVGVIPAEVAAEAFYAQSMRFFARNGLDAQIQVFDNGGAIAAAIAGGSLDVGLSDLVSVTSAHARGLPFVYVAPGLTASVEDPTMGIIVPTNSEIRDGKDFNGRTIAVGGLRNIAQVAAQAWIDGNGGDSRSVKFVEVPFPTLLPALAQGRIEAAFANEPWLTRALDAGYRVIWLQKNPLAPTFLQSGWVTTRDWIAAHPEAVRRFAAAIGETATWANAHPAEAAPILAEYTHTPLPVANRMHKGEFEARFDASTVQPVIDAAAKYGMIAKPFPAREIFFTAN